MTHVYPIYLVIDASDSMNDLLRGKNDSLEISADVDDSDLPSEESSDEETLIEYASNIPKAFYEEYENNPSLEKQLLVGVIAFNKSAEIVHELSSVKELENFKGLTASSRTHYSEAFKLVLETITEDYARPEASQWKRPAVIFVTDGGPNDDPKLRSHWFDKLVPRKIDGSVDVEKFENSPHFIIFAFRDVKPEILKRYVSDPTLLFIADTKLDLRSQFNNVIKQITETTFTSVYADQQNKSKNYRFSKIIQIPQNRTIEDDNDFLIRD